MKHSKQLLKRVLSMTLCLLMLTSVVMLTPSAETPITNLYDKTKAFAGYVNNKNVETESASHYTSERIAVTQGDVITFGPCKTQDFYIHGYNSSGNIQDSTVGINSKNIKKLESFSNTDWFILSYTVPADVTSVRVVNASAINDCFVITKNNGFTAVQFENYWKAKDNDTFKIACGEEFAKKTDSVLYKKSALFVGDSISCGSQEGSLYYRAWAGRIGVVNSMDYVNASVSGASCSTTRATNRIFSQLVANSSREFDYVIMHGGVNDAWDNAAVGEMVEGYSLTDFDTATFAGGLEHMFYYANLLYPNAKMGYIINFKAPNCTKGTVSDMDAYFAVAKEICEKWNIPVLNLYEDENFCNNVLKTNTTENLPDSIHPNTHGYDLLYPVIEAWMETLPNNTFTLDAENTVIKLSTEADLENLRTYPEATFELTNDIVLTKAWTPIATFSGTLDGKGHTIGGINIVNAATSDWSNSGFIAHANGCTVKNLTLKGSVSNTAASARVQIGGFAGQATNAKFINCTSEINISTGATSKGVYAGGIVGVVSKNTEVTLLDCINKGNLDIQAASYAGLAGGLVCHTNSTLSITGGINLGNISVTGRYLAGIVANSPSGSATTASYCTNVGTLKGTYYYTDSKQAGEFYGQIVGRVQGNGAAVSHCAGLGKYENLLTSTNYVGGIGGSTGTSKYTDCYTTYASTNGGILGYKSGTVTGGGIITADTDLTEVVSKLNAGLTAGNERFILDDGRIEPKYDCNNIPTQIYATQEATAAESNTVDLRVLALVNSLKYSKAGVELYRTGEASPVLTQETTTVYTGVMNGTDAVDAPYGTYWLPITLKGISASGTFTFDVRTFVVESGEKQYSERYSVTVTDGAVTSVSVVSE